MVIALYVSTMYIEIISMWYWEKLLRANSRIASQWTYTCSLVLSHMSGALKDYHVLSNDACKFWATTLTQGYVKTDHKPSVLSGFWAASIIPRFLWKENSHKMQTQVIAVDLTSIPCDYKKAECRAQRWEKKMDFS